MTHFDTRSSWDAFASGYNNDYIHNSDADVMHGEQYGQLRTFDANSAHSWETVGYPRAAATFAVQNRISSMLSSVVDLLIVGAEPSGNSNWTSMISRGLRSAHDDALWSPYHHPQFTPPVACNPDALLEKARNHLNLLVDEIELMQTSPEHMYKHALDVKACTDYDTNGEDTSEPADKVWTMITRELAITWINDIFTWQRIVSGCENLQRQLSESGCNVVTGARLTRKADAAMRCFGVAIRGFLLALSSEHRSRLITIVALQDHFARCASRDKVLGQDLAVTPAKEWVPSEQGDRLAFVAVIILNAVAKDRCTDNAWYMQKLKDELEGIKYNKLVENWISGLELMDELYISSTWRQTIDHHDPWDAKAQDRDLRSRDMVPIDFNELSKPVQEVQRVSAGDKQRGQLLQAFCKLAPPEVVKNMSWLKRMTESRRRLTKFWDCVLTTRKIREVKIKRSETFTAQMLAHMSFDLAPRYLGEVEEERKRIQSDDQQAKALRQNCLLRSCKKRNVQ